MCAEVSDIGLQQVHFSEVRGDGAQPASVVLERNELCNAHRMFYRAQATDPNVAQRKHELKYSLEAGALSTRSA